MSGEEQRGYDCAVSELLNNSNAQELYDIAEADPFINDFTRGWQKACIEYGAKVT